jgi:hypothetical protein
VLISLSDPSSPDPNQGAVQESRVGHRIGLDASRAVAVGAFGPGAVAVAFGLLWSWCALILTSTSLRPMSIAPIARRTGYQSAPDPVPELRDSLGILHLVHDTLHPPPLLARNVLADRLQQFFQAPGTQHVVLVNDRDDQPALRQDEFDVVVKVELARTINQQSLRNGPLDSLGGHRCSAERQ